MTVLVNEVIDQHTCTGCGACVALGANGSAQMLDTENGPIPEFTDQTKLADYTNAVCPGLGVNYPELYTQHYGHHLENWLAGYVEKVRIVFSDDPSERSSGLRIPQKLIYLLKIGNPSLVTTCNLKGY